MIELASLRGRIKSKLGLKPPSKLSRYAGFLENEPVDDKTILLESRHGDAFEGNIYYIAREILGNPEYSDYKVYVPARKKKRAIVERHVATLPKPPIIITLESVEYYRVLATAKYLVNDTSFAHAFYKRPDQVYINTWHGTPLKHLGRNVLNERVKMSNVQRNFLCADYLLYPNEHTKQAIFSDYMLEPLFSGKVLYAGYPRNEVFFQADLQQTIRQRFNLTSKKVYAYMPTYRGLNRNLHVNQFEELENHLRSIDSTLSNDEILFLNLHPFMANSISCDGFEHIRMFPDEVPSYDFLSIADALITDYSSVMFDFACTGRPVVLFAYDLEEYYSDRGTYLSLEDLPFRIVDSPHDVIPAVRSSSIDYADFQERYCKYDAASCSKNLVKLMFGIDEKCNGFKVVDYSDICRKPAALIFVDGLDPFSISKLIADYFEDESLSKYSYYVSFRRTDKNAVDLIDHLDPRIGFFSLGGKACRTPEEITAAKSYRQGKMTFDVLYESLDHFLIREFQRRYGISNFQCGVNLGAYKRLNAFLLLRNIPEVDIVIPERYSQGFPSTIPSASEEVFYKELASRYEAVSDGAIVRALINPDAIRGGSYILEAPRLYNTTKGLCVSATLRLRTPFRFNFSDLVIRVGDFDYKPDLRNVEKGGIAKPGLNRIGMKLVIPYTDLHQFSIQNFIRAGFLINGELIKSRAIRYNWIRSSYRAARGPFYFDDALGVTAFFRQSKKGNLAFTVRHRNVTDGLTKRIMLKLAWAASRLTRFRRGPVLLFEKNSSKYEEGAKVLFEYLIDKGYSNIRFILDADTIQSLSEIESKYRSRFIRSHTFKHYYSFFLSRTFIGTETMAHSLELRVEEKHAKQKLVDPSNTYVFLQHGPTYMVSLDSPQRTFFRKSEQPGRMYIAANSEKEKAHFVELGGFDPDSILVSGMPKFDSAFSYPNADKIVIMPTWRAWEFNEVRSNPTETKYWKLIQDIKNSIPVDLQDKVIIQAHPLFNFAEGGGIKQSNNIDELLRNTRVLITDYSSVAYDAFYRGANVIFFWKEKDECMEHYGYPTHLMIDDETAPGFVCYESEEISQIIRSAYSNAQPDYLVQRFREIVSFHDGNNTSRLVKMLTERGVL